MQRLAVIPLFLLLLFSCKKEPTTWQTDWSAPVAHGHLTLGDLVPEENITTNSDNYISLVYHGSLYTFTLDTLVDLPDTTIYKKSAVGVSSLNVGPGFSYTDSYDQLYDLDQIELKKVRVKSGSIAVEIHCPWQGASVVTFNFPKITDNGVPFVRTYYMPAASQTSPAVSIETIDIAHYFIDLTGISGNLINMLSAEFTMGSNEATATYTITDTDSIEYEIRFQNLVPDYAKGYFGQYQFIDTAGLSLDFMKNITAGQLNLDSINLTLTVKNGFNLIAQAKITHLKGYNSKNGSIYNLSFPELNNSMNINPASGGIYDFVPSEYPITINNSNSTIIPFIENMNDSVSLGYELNINPFGNVTAGSDEVFPGSAFELFLDAEFPVKFGANGMTVVDTFKVNYNDPDGVYPENGEFILSYSNGFPLGGQAVFYLLDEYDEILDSIQSSGEIFSGTYQSSTSLTTPYSGQLTYSVSRNQIMNLDKCNRLILQVVFSTDQAQNVKVSADAYFDFVLNSNLKLNIKL